MERLRKKEGRAGGRVEGEMDGEISRQHSEFNHRGNASRVIRGGV